MLNITPKSGGKWKTKELLRTYPKIQEEFAF
jgi:hypothetical protein